MSDASPGALRRRHPAQALRVLLGELSIPWR
jgi:hypothetical protein